jgi:hypothetical protein
VLSFWACKLGAHDLTDFCDVMCVNVFVVDTLPGKIPPQADLGDLEGMEAGFTSGNMTIDGKKFEPTKAYKDSKCA